MFQRLARILHIAKRAHVNSRNAAATGGGNVRHLPVMARARVPIGNMPRVGEIDGPTVFLPRQGQPGVNAGGGYRSRRRSSDVNSVPSATRWVA